MYLTLKKKTDHMLELNIRFNKFTRNESIQRKFTDHIRIKLELNNKKISGKIPKYLETLKHTSK